MFHQLVAAAIDALPGEFRDKLSNIEIVVEDWPNQAVLQRSGITHPAGLLGYYQGVPQTRRTHHYGMVLPDKISIYQRPIELRCTTVEEIEHTIMQVLRHEIAHHFGIDDQRLRELGVY
ncbi:MAG: metallopeptidase family protein [Anaerolineae bacterium]|nr:metallopeptidase family protein [Anaerolineae bacterium]